MSDEYEARAYPMWGPTECYAIYCKRWPSDKWETISIGGTKEAADAAVAKLAAVEAIYDATQDGDGAWRDLLAQVLPDAPLCNCGRALYGCKYGCEWNMSRTREAVASVIRKRASENRAGSP